MNNQRIHSIDWLKGLMILIIVIYHSYFFPNFRGYLAVDVFFYISGYFLMSGFLRRPSTAVHYTWSRIKQMAAPYFISLILLCAILERGFSSINSQEALIDLCGKLFSAIPFGDEFAGIVTRTPFAPWFLSVLIIASFILYAMLEYNDRLATLILFPAIVLFGYNAIFNHTDCLNNFERIGMLGLPLVRGLSGMAAGALICHVHVRHKAGIDRYSTLINVLGIIGFILFMALMFSGVPLDRYILFTIPWILLASVIDRSWSNKILSRINGGLFARIGRYTLYVYCIHGVGQMLLFWINDHLLHHALSGASLFIAYLVAVVAATVVLYYVCQFVIRFIKDHENQPDHPRL